MKTESQNVGYIELALQAYQETQASSAALWNKKDLFKSSVKFQTHSIMLTWGEEQNVGNSVQKSKINTQMTEVCGSDSS